ncbi:MAG: guanylate kinase [Alphaproteobacteria bacterium]
MSSKAGARRGLMFVLSSPSGAGKSTLARRLMQRNDDIVLSISATTRPPRPGEVDGREYHFVDHQRFEAMIDEGALLEWARVFDNYYGTPRAPVEAALSAGKDVLFDVDWQGARALRGAAPEDCVSVFILPPDMDELERRLHTRAQDSEEVIARRMAKSADEIRHWDEYDHVIVNRDLDASAEDLQRILDVERSRRSRQIWLADFVKTLLNGR